jgi:hypothetical protein
MGVIAGVQGCIDDLIHDTVESVVTSTLYDLYDMLIDFDTDACDVLSALRLVSRERRLTKGLADDIMTWRTREEQLLEYDDGPHVPRRDRARDHIDALLCSIYARPDAVFI